MKLTELDPHWLMRGDEKVGFIFRCPTRRECWQSCFFEAPERREQWALAAKTLGQPDGFPRVDFQGARQGTRWSIVGEFENLTVSPSIDGSAGGNWHGFITNGEIVGGL